MQEEVIIIPLFFGIIFGIFYLFISARNKERLALIEKGADASIFYGKNRVTPVWKVVVINIACLLMGIGLGIFIGGLFSDSFGMREDIAMPGAILFCAGFGLISGFFVTKKLSKDV